MDKAVATPNSRETPNAHIAFGVTDVALISMALIWGMNFVIVKTTLNEIAPFAFMTIRFALASLAFFVIARLWSGGFHIARKDWGRVIFLGVVGTTFYQPLFVEGLSMTDASNSSLILASTPAFIALFNRFISHERLSLRGWLGILLSFVGIVLIVISGGQLAIGSAALLGDLYILGATLCWSLYSIYATPLLKAYSPLAVSGLTTIVGTLPILMLGVPPVLAQNWSGVSLGAWGGLTYSILFAIVIAYIIWNNGLQKLGGARTALYSNLIPVVASIAAALFLGELLTPLKMIGALVIFIGLALARTARVIQEPEG